MNTFIEICFTIGGCAVLYIEYVWFLMYFLPIDPNKSSLFNKTVFRIKKVIGIVCMVWMGISICVIFHQHFVGFLVILLIVFVGIGRIKSIQIIGLTFALIAYLSQFFPPNEDTPVIESRANRFLEWLTNNAWGLLLQFCIIISAVSILVGLPYAEFTDKWKKYLLEESRNFDKHELNKHKTS